jgi:predicted Zn-dependent protease
MLNFFDNLKLNYHYIKFRFELKISHPVYQIKIINVKFTRVKRCK